MGVSYFAICNWPFGPHNRSQFESSAIYEAIGLTTRQFSSSKQNVTQDKPP